jgi:hypothetical protein
MTRPAHSFVGPGLSLEWEHGASAASLTPDAWQAELLRRRQQQVLLLASRQAGKSTVVAGAALHEALTVPGSLILLLSASGRQSGELFVKVKDLWSALGRPVAARTPRDNALRLELANGSRVISLPGEESTIRGYSGVALLVIDEAARVDDGLYYSVRPMLAASRGRLIALTTHCDGPRCLAASEARRSGRSKWANDCNN